MSATSKFTVLLVTVTIGFTAAVIGSDVGATLAVGVPDVAQAHYLTTAPWHQLPDCLACGLTD